MRADTHRVANEISSSNEVANKIFNTNKAPFESSYRKKQKGFSECELQQVGLDGQRTSVGPNLQEDKPEVSGESVPEGGVRLATGSCGIKSKGSTLEYSGIVTIK
jgi:hypothetical protein